MLFDFFVLDSKLMFWETEYIKLIKLKLFQLFSKDSFTLSYGTFHGYSQKVIIIILFYFFTGNAN